LFGEDWQNDGLRCEGLESHPQGEGILLHGLNSIKTGDEVISIESSICSVQRYSPSKQISKIQLSRRSLISFQTGQLMIYKTLPRDPESSNIA